MEVSITRVPSHVGITGNEVADDLADEGRKRVIALRADVAQINGGYGLTTAAALRCARKHIRSQVLTSGVDLSRSSFERLVYPRWQQTELLRLPQEKLDEINALVFRTSPLRTHRQRGNNTLHTTQQGVKCKCGRKETTEHYVERCPRFEEQRQVLRDALYAARVRVDCQETKDKDGKTVKYQSKGLLRDALYFHADRTYTLGRAEALLTYIAATRRYPVRKGPDYSILAEVGKKTTIGHSQRHEAECPRIKRQHADIRRQRQAAGYEQKCFMDARAKKAKKRLEPTTRLPGRKRKKRAYIQRNRVGKRAKPNHHTRRSRRSRYN